MTLTIDLVKECNDLMAWRRGVFCNQRVGGTVCRRGYPELRAAAKLSHGKLPPSDC